MQSAINRYHLKKILNSHFLCCNACKNGKPFYLFHNLVKYLEYFDNVSKIIYASIIDFPKGFLNLIITICSFFMLIFVANIRNVIKKILLFILN